MGRLDGKRVLVTAASSGIGREAANRVARKGARLAVGERDPERVQRTVVEIGESNARHRRLEKLTPFPRRSLSRNTPTSPPSPSTAKGRQGNARKRKGTNRVSTTCCL